MSRVEYNEHFKYSLALCLERIGLKKDDEVAAYIETHKLYERIEGQGAENKRPCYERVPRALIVHYGCADARGTFALAKNQQEKFRLTDASGAVPVPVHQVVLNETKLTRACFDLERTGIRVDLSFCHDAYRYETNRAQMAAVSFEQATGMEDFTDSAKALSPFLIAAGIPPGKTADGRISYADAVLQKNVGHELVDLIYIYRDASKRANTYFGNYLQYADSRGRIHADLAQYGTKTGRFSCRNPNLQNLNAEGEDAPEDTSRYPVRRAFIPDDGYCFLSLDFQAQEYRLMLDYAQETSVIDQVKSGVDLHLACAQMMGVTRTQAKTINFCLLYGGGAAKLAEMLGLPQNEAVNLRKLYFSRLPKIRQFIRSSSEAAERRGYVFGWMGRRCYFPEPQFAYRAGNAIIQGGCADITKKAMNDCATYLAGKRSKMVLTIHDEVLFLLHREELEIAPDLAELMVKAYPARSLPMAVAASFSWKSWGDLEDGFPLSAVAV